MKQKPKHRTTALGYIIAVIPVINDKDRSQTYVVAGIAPSGHVAMHTTPIAQKEAAMRKRAEWVKLHRELARERAERSAKRKKVGA